VHDHRAINRRIEMKTRIAAAEARCGPKQTHNNEGRAYDLQIQMKKAARPTFWKLLLLLNPPTRV
jgi:hypothetical protein